jgi:hypothetical protein
MRIPNFDDLGLQTADDGISQSYAVHMHPNPRFYKYVWWVFWRGSVCDGCQFLSDTHALSTAEAMVLMEKLSAENERHWIYNRRISRYEPGVTPFHRDSEKWRHYQFAPVFADDADPEWYGFR